MKNFIKKQEGITLIALVVTIIVLLILAGVAISMLNGENGILNQSAASKQQIEMSSEREVVRISSIQTLQLSNNNTIQLDIFQNIITNEIGENIVEVSQAGENIEVLFERTKRYYKVDKQGNVGEANYLIEDKYAGDITKGAQLDGSEQRPYEINCIEDLVVFSNMVNGSGIKIQNGEAVSITTSTAFTNKYVKLNRNLDFESNYSYLDSERTDFGNINGDDTDGNTLKTEMTTGYGFIPIGNANKRCSCIFEGQNNSIINLYQNLNADGGLFGATTRGMVISNLKIYVDITSTSGNAGGLVGSDHSSVSIKNCSVYGNIISDLQTAGGLIGSVYLHNGSSGPAEISDCYIDANITGNYNGAGSSIGVISGNTAKVIIKNTCNHGIINWKGNQVHSGLGGIVGTVYGNSSCTVENSVNYGDLKTIDGYAAGGFKGIGGIVGYINASSLKIKNSFNIGSELGEGSNIGGIVGREQNVTDFVIAYINCYYKNNIVTKGVGSGTESLNTIGKEENYMKTEAFVDELNNAIETGVAMDKLTNTQVTMDTTGWAKWVYNIGSYPTLDLTTKWNGTEWIKN